MMTAHGSEDVAVEAMKSGAVDYVVKEGLWLGTACRRVEAAARARQQCGPLPANPGTSHRRLLAKACWGRSWNGGKPLGRTLGCSWTYAGRRGRYRGQRGLNHGEAARHLQRATLLLEGSTGAADSLSVALMTAQAEASGAGELNATRLVGRGRRLRGPGRWTIRRRSRARRSRMRDASRGSATRYRTVPWSTSARGAARPPARGFGPPRAHHGSARRGARGDRHRGRPPVARPRGRTQSPPRRLDDPAVIAAVIHTAHWALWHPEESDNRLMLADEAIALAERLGDRAMLLEGALLRFWCLLDVGDFAGAKTQLEVAGRLVEAAAAHYEWLVLMGRTALAYGAAPVPDVEALAAEAVSAGHRAQNPMPRCSMPRRSAPWLGSRAATGGRRVAGRHRRRRPGPWADGAVCSGHHVGGDGPCRRGTRDPPAAPGRRLLARHPEHHLAAGDELPCRSMCGPAGRARRRGAVRGATAVGRTSCVTLPPLILYGPVSYYLGRLAATLGDWDRAVRHFDDALDLAGRAHAYRWLVRTQVACSTMLLERGERDDVLLARARLSGAARMAVDLGMEGLSRHVERLQVARGDNGVAPPTVAVTRGWRSRRPPSSAARASSGISSSADDER